MGERLCGVRRLAVLGAEDFDQSPPAANRQVIVDLDEVLLLVHSEKQDATATWKKTFGHHPPMGSSTTNWR